MQSAVDENKDEISSSSISPARSSSREEPEVIKKWKEEQLKQLEAKDKLEETEKVKLRAQAKKELEEWYAQHADQLAKLQQTHRAASESSEKEIASSTLEIKPGTEWERVAKLCDFNPKTARNTKDVSRLRSVILHLKQGGSKTSIASANNV